MRYIFCLSGDYIGIAQEEVFSLLEVSDFVLLRNLLIADLKNNEEFTNDISKTLALTKSIYRFLFECKINELVDKIKGYDWNSVYKNSFCLRVHYLVDKSTSNSYKNFNEKNLAKYIWRSLSKPKVDLTNPKTKVEVFILDDNVYCGLLIHENKEDFESRKAHLRPFSHPSSLHPKLARALVNISEIKDNEILLDPFCGTGGFLIEAGLMKIKVFGFDIGKNAVEGCKENLNHFGIKKYRIFNKNALEIKNNVDYVVTDLPYGLNSNIYLQFNKKSINETSKNQGFLGSRKSKRFSWKSNKINLKINRKNQIKNIEQFYLKFLQKLRKVLKKKAVIIFPSYVDYKKLLKKSRFKIEKEFSIHVHRSLTRKIVKIV